MDTWGANIAVFAGKGKKDPSRRAGNGRKLRFSIPAINSPGRDQKEHVIADRTQGHKLFSAKTTPETPVTTGRQGRCLCSSELATCYMVFIFSIYLPFL
jgi:hypothetical protein